MSTPAKSNLFIDGKPAPKDLVSSTLFETHVKKNHTYTSGGNTYKVEGKTWERLPSGTEYDVRLQTAAPEKLSVKPLATVPDIKVLENLALDEILIQDGVQYRISHIHWQFTSGSSLVDLVIYGEPLATVPKQ